MQLLVRGVPAELRQSRSPSLPILSPICRKQFSLTQAAEAPAAMPKKTNFPKKILRQLSGTALEERIDEYSTVYGEVLLGLHHDTTSLGGQVHQQDEQLRVLAQRTSYLDAQFTRFQQQMEQLPGLRDEVGRLGTAQQKLHGEVAVAVEASQKHRNAAAALERQIESLSPLLEMLPSLTAAVQSSEYLYAELLSQRRALRRAQVISVVSLVMACAAGVAAWILS
jgi:DNA repair exonuclease SbcCD ATPase subunit